LANTREPTREYTKHKKEKKKEGKRKKNRGRKKGLKRGHPRKKGGGTCFVSFVKNMMMMCQHVSVLLKI